MLDITSPKCYVMLREHASIYRNNFSHDSFQLLSIDTSGETTSSCFFNLALHNNLLLPWKVRNIIFIKCYFQPYSFYLLLNFFQRWFGLCVEHQSQLTKVWLIVHTFRRFLGPVPDTCLMISFLLHSRSYPP